MVGTVPRSLADWMWPFVRCFTGATWDHVLVLVAGALLSPGRRTVSAALRVLDQSASFAVYHRVLSTARWSARRIAHRLLHLLVAAFVRDGPVVIGLDDTIERRWGTKIKARGIYRDPVRSSHGHFVKASGLRWLCVMLLAPIPWAGCVWALPFLTILAPSERYAQKRGRRHKTLTDVRRCSRPPAGCPTGGSSPTAAFPSSSCCAPSAHMWMWSPGCGSMPACMNRHRCPGPEPEAAPASKGRACRP